MSSFAGHYFVEFVHDGNTRILPIASLDEMYKVARRILSSASNGQPVMIDFGPREVIVLPAGTAFKFSIPDDVPDEGAAKIRMHLREFLR